MDGQVATQKLGVWLQQPVRSCLAAGREVAERSGHRCQTGSRSLRGGGFGELKGSDDRAGSARLRSPTRRCAAAGLSVEVRAVPPVDEPDSRSRSYLLPFLALCGRSSPKSSAVLVAGGAHVTSPPGFLSFHWSCCVYWPQRLFDTVHAGPGTGGSRSSTCPHGGSRSSARLVGRARPCTVRLALSRPQPACGAARLGGPRWGGCQGARSHRGPRHAPPPQTGHVLGRRGS